MNNTVLHRPIQKTGKQGGLFFLLISPDPIVLPPFDPWHYPASEQVDLLFVEHLLTHVEQTDRLITLSEAQALLLKKKHPDVMRVIARLSENETVPGPAVMQYDYVVWGEGYLDHLWAIIQAEQSRRVVINARSTFLTRHIYHQTATAVLFNHARTRMLLIQRNDDGRWFPPGGHVEEGEYPHDAVLREVREEAGRMATFLLQPDTVGETLDAATIPPQPYCILVEDLSTHSHHDFVYLCECPEEGTPSECLTRWFTLQEVMDLPSTPLDIKRIAHHFQQKITPEHLPLSLLPPLS